MQSNLYLFTGENQYELHAELQRWKKNFSQKFGADAIFSYTSENRDVGNIKQSLFGGGLFVTKKLLILSGLPLDNEQTNKLRAEQLESLTEELMGNSSGIPVDTILICVSYKPDKRGRFYKWISKEGQVKNFPLLDVRALRLFIKQEATDLKLSDAVIDALIRKVGIDQFRIVSELEKLYFYQQSYPEVQISESLIDEVCFGMTEAESFTFFNHLFTTPQKACKILEDMQYQGVDRNQAIGMLYWGLKNYLTVADFLSQGISDSKAIASETKQNPFSIMTILKQAKALEQHLPGLKQFYKRLIETDYAIKT